MSMQQSLQKNHAIFLQGLLFLYKNAVFEPTIGILAKNSSIFSARMELWSKVLQELARVAIAVSAMVLVLDSPR